MKDIIKAPDGYKYEVVDDTTVKLVEEEKQADNIYQLEYMRKCENIKLTRTEVFKTVRALEEDEAYIEVGTFMHPDFKYFVPVKGSDDFAYIVKTEDE